MGCGERGDGDGWPLYAVNGQLVAAVYTRDGGMFLTYGEGRWDVALCGLTPAHDMRSTGVHCEVGRVRRTEARCRDGGLKSAREYGLLRGGGGVRLA